MGAYLLCFYAGGTFIALYHDFQHHRSVSDAFATLFWPIGIPLAFLLHVRDAAIRRAIRGVR